jgi:hypothetical protein
MSARELENWIKKSQRDMDNRFLNRQVAVNNPLEEWADAETMRVLDRLRRQR